MVEATDLADVVRQRAGINVDTRSDRTGSADRPDVLLIVLDDRGYNDVSELNGNDMPTPTAAALVREGAAFTRHHAEAVCSSGR